MKASKKEMIFSTLLCLLPILLGLALWNRLPAQVPTHFDLNNNPNGYSSKAFAVFGLPAVMAGIQGICLFGMQFDPKREKQSKTLGKLMLWFVPVLSCILTPMCLLMALGMRINIGLILRLFIGILFIVVGNYLPKCKQNYTMGIKLPWTLNDEDNWNYTHRVGGYTWVIGGFLQVANAFLGRPLAMFGITLILVLIPTVASYLYYRKHKK